MTEEQYAEQSHQLAHGLLTDLGFKEVESYIHPWAYEYVIIEKDESGEGLWIEVWEEFNHGRPGMVHLNLISRDHEATATLTNKSTLREVLPFAIRLIDLCKEANKQSHV